MAQNECICNAQRRMLSFSEYDQICEMREELDEIISKIEEPVYGSEEFSNADGLYNLLSSALGAIGQLEEQFDPREL